MDERIIIAIGIVLILLILYFILKFCDKFRVKVYKLFIEAEKHIKSGEKMQYVVDNIYMYLPRAITIFINEKSLTWIIQKMFDKVKDFLNDGKFNGNEE